MEDFNKLPMCQRCKGYSPPIEHGYHIGADSTHDSAHCLCQYIRRLCEDVASLAMSCRSNNILAKLHTDLIKFVAERKA